MGNTQFLSTERLSRRLTQLKSLKSELESIPHHLPMPHMLENFCSKRLRLCLPNATGAAVSNSIKVIEYLKTHIKGLHISYNILSKEFVDEYEPKVEGLDKVTTTRTVSTLEAKLTITKGDELAQEVGYMPPNANEDEVDQKGFEESMAKYNERKSNKPEGEEGP